jgi:hypothetical protein
MKSRAMLMCRRHIRQLRADDDDDEMESVRESHLQTNFLSFRTFWFLVSTLHRSYRPTCDRVMPLFRLS